MGSNEKSSSRHATHASPKGPPSKRNEGESGGKERRKSVRFQGDVDGAWFHD